MTSLDRFAAVEYDGARREWFAACYDPECDPIVWQSEGFPRGQLGKSQAKAAAAGHNDVVHGVTR